MLLVVICWLLFVISLCYLCLVVGSLCEELWSEVPPGAGEVQVPQ